MNSADSSFNPFQQAHYLHSSFRRLLKKQASLLGLKSWNSCCRRLLVIGKLSMSSLWTLHKENCLTISNRFSSKRRLPLFRSMFKLWTSQATSSSKLGDTPMKNSPRERTCNLLSVLKGCYRPRRSEAPSPTLSLRATGTESGVNKIGKRFHNNIWRFTVSTGPFINAGVEWYRASVVSPPTPEWTQRQNGHRNLIPKIS